MRTVMASEPSKHADACHNCRRQRRKCDRSLPHCAKCATRGQTCLGYQRLFLWQNGVASRGKLSGRALGDPQRPANIGIMPLVPLADPLLQDLPHAARSYLSYFASTVCKDLVLYDDPRGNHFRELLPLTHHYSILLHIITAISALHMSNKKGTTSKMSATVLHLDDRAWQLDRSGSSSFAVSLAECYSDALRAKHRALCLLKSSIGNIGSNDIDVVLATMLLFIEFDLIDTGRDDWKHHIHGARTITERLFRLHRSTRTAMSPLRSCLIANCIVFDILGSSLATSDQNLPADMASTDTLSLLQDAEGNHCSSFPTILLHLLRCGARLARFSASQSTEQDALIVDIAEGKRLLQVAEDFDPLAWARHIQSRTAVADLLHRTHIASAHQSAVRIYLTRVLLTIDPTAHIHSDPEVLAADIIRHLSIIRPHDPLFTAMAWPAFIAGAETDDVSKQGWVRSTFHELWQVQPWGLIKGALSVLENIWSKKSDNVIATAEGNIWTASDVSGDWIMELRRTGVDWLIV